MPLREDSKLAELAGRLGLNVSTAPAFRPRKRVEEDPGSNAGRVGSLPEMIGQDTARTRLAVHVQGAMELEQTPGHVLLCGPPGLGKTTIAEIVAHETKGRLVRAMGSQITDTQMLGNILSKLGRDRIDVLFIDEAHALKRNVMELLYMGLEDGRIELKTGRGAEAVIRSIKLPPFVLVAATTLPGWLTQPFRERFGLELNLEFYTEDELTEIILQRAEQTGAKLDKDGAVALAMRSRGTPRVARRLLQRAWAYTAVVHGSKDVPITMDMVTEALELDGIDALGLNAEDRAVLAGLCDFKGLPVGGKNLADSVGIDVKSLDMTELWLIRSGLMRRTRRGRVATKAAFDHLGRECPITVDDESQHSDAAWEDRGE